MTTTEHLQHGRKEITSTASHDKLEAPLPFPTALILTHDNRPFLAIPFSPPQLLA